MYRLCNYYKKRERSRKGKGMKRDGCIIPWLVENHCPLRISWANPVCSRQKAHHSPNNSVCVQSKRKNERNNKLYDFSSGCLLLCPTAKYQLPSNTNSILKSWVLGASCNIQIKSILVSENWGRILNSRKAVTEQTARS